MLEAERDALLLHLEHNIIRVKVECGAIYNENAPLLILPTEITCLIFEYAVSLAEELKSGEDDNEIEKKYLTEVVVTHVCRHWRRVALAFPNIWTKLRYTTECPRLSIDRFDAYMERSASHNLDLWFDFTKINLVVEDERPFTLLEKSFLHIGRWKRISMFSESELQLVFDVKKLENVSAPNLQYFSCCSGTTDAVISGKPMVDATIFKGGAPKLQSVWLDGETARYCIPPLTNITTFRLESQNENDHMLCAIFLGILGLPCLENLSIINIYADDIYYPKLPILMKRLKILRFGKNEGSCFVCLLPFLRAPLLETLILMDVFIDLGHYDAYSSLEKDKKIDAFPLLRQLYLFESGPLSPQSTAIFLEMTKSATHVTISHTYSDNYFFLEYPVLEDVWPNLINLSYPCYLDLFFLGLLRPFVMSRSMKPLTLQILERRLKEWKDAYPDDYVAFEEKGCTMQGIDLESGDQLAQFFPEFPI